MQRCIYEGDSGFVTFVDSVSVHSLQEEAGNGKLVPVEHPSQPGRRAADDPQVSTDRVCCSWAKSDFFFWVSCGQKIGNVVGTVGFLLL